MVTVLDPIHAHVTLDGVVLIVRTVYAYLAVKMGFATYRLNVNATLAGQECSVTNVSYLFEVQKYTKDIVKYICSSNQ